MHDAHKYKSFYWNTWLQVFAAIKKKRCLFAKIMIFIHRKYIPINIPLFTIRCGVDAYVYSFRFRFKRQQSVYFCCCSLSFYSSQNNSVVIYINIQIKIKFIIENFCILEYRVFVGKWSLISEKWDKFSRTNI